MEHLCQMWQWTNSKHPCWIVCAWAPQTRLILKTWQQRRLLYRFFRMLCAQTGLGMGLSELTKCQPSRATKHPVGISRALKVWRIEFFLSCCRQLWVQVSWASNSCALLPVLHLHRGCGLLVFLQGWCRRRHRDSCLLLDTCIKRQFSSISFFLPWL